MRQENKLSDVGRCQAWINTDTWWLKAAAATPEQQLNNVLYIYAYHNVYDLNVSATENLI